VTPGWCAQGSIRPLEYLWLLDLPAQADPLEILSVDGGYRVTDSFEVFPKIECRDMIFPFDGIARLYAGAQNYSRLRSAPN